MEAHAAGSGVPLVAGGVMEDPFDRLPGLAAVIGAKEHSWCGAEPEPPGLVRAARFDVPGLLQRRLAVARQAQFLGTSPRCAEICGTVHAGAVDGVVRGRVKRSIPTVEKRVEDLPPGQQRPFQLPVPPLLVASEQEEALA